MPHRIFAVLAALAFLLFALAAAAQSNIGVAVKSPLAADGQFVERVIELTNIERVRLGLPPLKRQESLCASARWLAGDMAANRYFAHVDRLGRNIEPRFPNFGYKDYAAIGENIAAGQRTPREAVDAWLKSPGHRANLLNADFREIGVSYVYAPHSEYGGYWVQDFGLRADTFPLIINLDAAQTKSPEVKLYIHGDIWTKTMRLSSNGADWTNWEPYRPDRDWKLNTQEGRQTVFVELNNGSEIRRSSASIELINPVRAAIKPVVKP